VTPAGNHPLNPITPRVLLILAGIVALLGVGTETSGQLREFSVPELLGAINSGSEDISPLLSPDGSTLYFARAFHSSNVGGATAGTDIWYSRTDAGGKWSTPVNSGPVWNTSEHNAVAGINTDGKTIYLLNTYKGLGGLAFSRNQNGEWLKPQPIAVKGIGKHEYVGYYVNPTFDVLLISRMAKHGQGHEDLYVSVKDSLDKWSELTNLGPTINTAGFEIAPFLSADKRTLYFSSNGHGGEGDSDIFMAERLYDSWTVWTKPVNLGPNINSSKFDSYFSIYGDSVCFFSSNRDSKFSEIYKAKVKAKSEPGSREAETIFLTEAELRSLAGHTLRTELSFNQNGEFRQSHKDQIQSIAKVLQSHKDLNIRLMVRKSGSKEELDLNQQVLLTVLGHFKTLGIPGTRVTFGSENDGRFAQDARLPVLIRFYR
jgi:hypothetical protein